MRKRKERMSEGKKNIIAALLKEYDIQSAEDIQDALKDLLGGTIESMLEVTEKWQPHYPNAMKSWSTNWDVISPIFKFSSDVRKVIYTTNAIESLNSTYRRLNRQRSVF